MLLLFFCQLHGLAFINKRDNAVAGIMLRIYVLRPLLSFHFQRSLHLITAGLHFHGTFVSFLTRARTPEH